MSYPASAADFTRACGRACLSPRSRRRAPTSDPRKPPSQMLSSLALRLKALSPFQIVLLALLALAVLGSSTAVASNLITGADVKDRSLTGRDIARGTVSHSNLKDDSVTSRDIKDDTVHSADLSPGVREQLAKSGAAGVVAKDGTKGEKGDTGS